MHSCKNNNKEKKLKYEIGGSYVNLKFCLILNKNALHSTDILYLNQICFSIFKYLICDKSQNLMGITIRSYFIYRLNLNKSYIIIFFFDKYYS